MSDFGPRDESRAYQAQRESALNDMASWDCNRGRAHSPMKPLPTLKPIDAVVACFHPDTLRECELVTKRARGFLTGAEAFELCEITERQNARARAADLAHDQATEAHAYPANPSPHDA